MSSSHFEKSVSWRSPAWFAGAVVVLSLCGCANVPYPSELSGKKVLFRTMGADPTSIDPSFSYNSADDPIVCLMYPSFFRFKFLKRRPFETELCLGATEPERVPLEVTTAGSDGKPTRSAGERWTFRIKPGLKFQDDPCFPGGKGRAVTAADIVYSFKRMADPSVQCPIASYLADKIVGFQAYADGFAAKKKAQYDAEIPGVQQDPHDPLAFSVTLSQRYPQLRFLMAMHFTAPQSREAVEKYGDKYGLNHPVGCGLFMLQEYRPHQLLIQVRNPNAPPEYFPSEADPELRGELTDAGKKLPLVDVIYRQILTEPVTTYNLFQQGYLDALGISAGNAQLIPSSNGLTADMKARGVQLHNELQVSFSYLGFNMEDAQFGGYDEKHRKLRQAISLSIDSKAYIELISQGMGTPADWLIPPQLFGADPGYKNPYRQYDPKLEKAKQLLAEAGYPGGMDPSTGQRLKMVFDNSVTSPITRQITRLFTKQVEELGIQVDARDDPPALFEEKVRKKQIQFFDYGWLADYPDPENFALLLYGPNGSPGPNATLYNSPEYNALFEKMRSMDDGPERLAAIKRMREISIEDCPLIYVSNDETRTLVQPWARHMLMHPMGNDYLQYAAIDPEQRVSLQAGWNRPNFWPLLGFFFLGVAGTAPAVSTIRGRMNRRVRRKKPSGEGGLA